MDYASELSFFHPPLSVSLGAHEDLEIAVRQNFCSREQIPVWRRRSGGGALYLNPEQLQWALRLPAGNRSLSQVLQVHGEAVADALHTLGVAARFVFPNDLECEGKKLGSLFASRDADDWVLEGTLLIEALDVEHMLKALRVPNEKLSPEGIFSARSRMTWVRAWAPTINLETLKTAIGDALSRQFGRSGQALERVPPEPLPEPLTLEQSPVVIDDGRYEGFLKTPGGTLYLTLWPDEQGVITRAHWSGAVQLHPADLLVQLSETLMGANLESATDVLQAALDRLPQRHCLGFDDTHLFALLDLVLARRAQSHSLKMPISEANTLMVHGAAGCEAQDVLSRAEVMLVPYCAKPPDCKFRHRDGCSECGECSVGDAYRMARERGMQVTTITHFEHLQGVLDEMNERNVPAYVGMCCKHFYLKRQYAFEQAGIPAVLADIQGVTCYELQEEDLAYAGTFTAQADLNLPVVEKIMHFVPPLGKFLQNKQKN